MVIDWQQVVLNLRGHAPLSQLAKELGLHEGHLRRIAMGDVAEPRFNTGLRLLDAHEKYCRARHSLEHIAR
jgi:DNA-binding phage protein